jgi:hypothetical protein
MESLVRDNVVVATTRPLGPAVTYSDVGIPSISNA